MKNLIQSIQAAVNSARAQKLTLFGFEPSQGSFPAVLQTLATKIAFDENGKLKTMKEGKVIVLTISEKSTFEVIPVQRIEGEGANAEVQRFGLFNITVAAGKADGVDYGEFSTNVTAGTLAAIAQNGGTFEAKIQAKEYKVRRGRNTGEVREGFSIEAANKPKEENAFKFEASNMPAEIGENDSQKKSSKK